MSDDELDPEEMVKFDNKDVSLWTAVHDIMTQPVRKADRDRRVPRREETLDSRCGGHREDRAASGLQRTATAA
jgi:hypothetical protein